MDCIATTCAKSIFFGANIVQSRRLHGLHVVAMQPMGSTVWSGGHCRLYANPIEQANLQLSRQPLALPCNGALLSAIPLGLPIGPYRARVRRSRSIPWPGVTTRFVWGAVAP